MQTHIDSARQRLGELGAMQHQVTEMERRIVSLAESRLGDIDKELSAARAAAVGGDREAEEKYLKMIHERGRLHQVIASGRAVLSGA